MTSKKQLLKIFLEKEVNFNQLQADYNNSWFRNMSRDWLYDNGIVSGHFNATLIKKAIEYAGYIYPSSDRTWRTVLEVQRELVDEYIK